MTPEPPPRASQTKRGEPGTRVPVPAPDEAPWAAPQARPRTSYLARLKRIAYMLASFYLFVFALILMREGAGGLEPLVREHLEVDSVANSIGFGWLFAYAVMSGSPVAAAGLTLLDRGIVRPEEAFGIIAGSRLGASFIVLFLGFLYALRGHERRTSLSVGILSLVVTASLQVASLLVGVTLIRTGLVGAVEVDGGGQLISIVDRLVGGMAETVGAYAFGLGGAPLVFVSGLGVILLSFTLFDRGLPPLRLEGTALGDISRVLYRPIVMFALGLGVTLISMSVSVSLSLLVPLSARGYVRRENLIPYIMGANITTFVDTLFAALLLSSPWGFTIVLIQMATATVTALVILTTFLRRYEQAMLAAVSWSTRDDFNLTIFFLTIFIVPLVLLFW